MKTNKMTLKTAKLLAIELTELDWYPIDSRSDQIKYRIKTIENEFLKIGVMNEDGCIIAEDEHFTTYQNKIKAILFKYLNF